MYRRARVGKIDLSQLEAKPRKVSGETGVTSGARYQSFVAQGYPEKVLSGKLSIEEAGKNFGSNLRNVNKWLDAFIVEHANETARWMRDAPEVHTGDLMDFRKMHFPKFLTPAFHQEWASAIDDVVGSGDRLLLLAPQRHGKTELLIHYCVKRIIEDPDVRILWVSKTADLAEKAVGYIRQLLEHEQSLLELLRPGNLYRPGFKTGLPWTNGEFTVATRTKILKSPTMVALGAGGTILGRDADLIILDDPQDRQRSMSATNRQRDAEWFFTDFMSRKEENTGVAFIMSRQHTDDLPGRILTDHTDQWRVSLYQAHDPACTIPESDKDDHYSCVLWPDVRSFEWLMGQKKANPAHFARNYMMQPETDTMTFLSATDIEDRKDQGYPAGSHPGGRMVAGIDPASAKPTAAVLWCFRDGKRFLVDAVMASPGTKGVREIVKTWANEYGCRRYVLETNGYQGQALHDDTLRELARSVGASMVPHHTGVNKNDPGSGVVAMLHALSNEDGPYVLPTGGDRAVRDRLEQLYRQWLIFDPDHANARNQPDDLTMASWFPQIEMDRMDKVDAQKVVYMEDRTSYGSTSYGAMANYAGRS